MRRFVVSARKRSGALTAKRRAVTEAQRETAPTEVRAVACSAGYFFLS